MNHYYRFEPSENDRDGEPRVQDTRGLPNTQARLDLAKTYLRLQHDHWPELAGTTVLPELTQENYQLLAKQLRENYSPGVTQHIRPGHEDAVRLGSPEHVAKLLIE